MSARLVELDPRNVRTARAAAAANGLTGVEVVETDAGTTDAYAEAVPAELVLFCGVFGNITDADIERTVRALPMFCAPGATVIWTRGRWAPEVVAGIRRWFDETGFAEQSFEAPDGAKWSVGVDVLETDPVPLVPGERLFTFTR